MASYFNGEVLSAVAARGARVPGCCHDLLARLNIRTIVMWARLRTMASASVSGLAILGPFS